jgi:exosortase H (IPTLxxWG-CTERM-specific)
MKWPFSPIVRFVILFLVLLVLISAGFSQLFTRYHDKVLWLMEGTAYITGAAVSLFSDNVYYDGVHVSYKGFSIEIIDECTGLFEMLIFLAAVFSFPTTIKKKMIGVLMGLPAIFVFNLVRIAILLVVGAYSWATFNFMHLYLWQVTLIIMISTVWILWLYLVVYREKKPVAVSD